jgi:hypothetical protein
VTATIQCITQHEKQVIKTSCAVLAQAAQAAQYLPEHRLLPTLCCLAGRGQHEQLLAGDESKAAAVDVT